MKRAFATILAALASAIAAFGLSPSINDVNVNVTLHPDGSASVREIWDVVVTSGTEFYLVRENLGDIDINNLSVSEGGRRFSDTGIWDVNASKSEKAFKSGINITLSGLELCWGIGNYGPHTFEVSYEMTNTVKTLQDYDSFHMQLVSPGLSSPPQHVKVVIGAEGVQLDTTNTRMWGFGYYGEVSMDDGKVTYESTQPFEDESSVIALLRFDKGMFSSPSTLDYDFQAIFDDAMEGAFFGTGDEGDNGYEPLTTGQDMVVSLLSVGTLYLMLIYPWVRLFRRKTDRPSWRDKRKVLGMAPRKVMWYRDIPMNGKLETADFIMRKLGMSRTRNSVASAMILRMILNGVLSVHKNTTGRVNISFNKDASMEGMSEREVALYGMMLEASGEDEILQDKEFLKYAREHQSTVRNWSISCDDYARKDLLEHAWTNRRYKFTPDGQARARETLGMKKFLEDFTLIKERGTMEVGLWREYLVYGALFGIADKVAKELKDIDPNLFDQVLYSDFSMLDNVLTITRSLASSITYAEQPVYSSSTYSGGYGSTRSYSGYGGHSSFGGGRGFSGGGRGGGSR